MTVLSDLFLTKEPIPLTPSLVHRHTGQLLSEYAALGMEFRGEHRGSGYRVIICKIREHRAMVAEDIGGDDVMGLVASPRT